MSSFKQFWNMTITSFWGNIDLSPQLPYSYYFTTRILVLKFVNEGEFFEEIQDLHFKKGGILVLTSVNLEKKGLFLMSSVLPWRGGFIWADKSVFYHKKGFILDWKVSALSQKRGHFELKIQCFATKRRSFLKWRKG